MPFLMVTSYHKKHWFDSQSKVDHANNKSENIIYLVTCKFTATSVLMAYYTQMPLINTNLGLPTVINYKYKTLAKNFFIIPIA